jgi:hypothetical protein
MLVSTEGLPGPVIVKRLGKPAKLTKERVEPSLRREAQLKAVFGYQVGDLPRPSSTTAGCAEARLSADIGSSFISISQIAAQVSRSTGSAMVMHRLPRPRRFPASNHCRAPLSPRRAAHPRVHRAALHTNHRGTTAQLRFVSG